MATAFLTQDTAPSVRVYRMNSHNPVLRKLVRSPPAPPSPVLQGRLYTLSLIRPLQTGQSRLQAPSARTPGQRVSGLLLWALYSGPQPIITYELRPLPAHGPLYTPAMQTLLLCTLTLKNRHSPPTRYIFAAIFRSPAHNNSGRRVCFRCPWGGREERGILPVRRRRGGRTSGQKKK